MRGRWPRTPRRVRALEIAHQARSEFEAARCKAAQPGLALGRDHPILEAVRTLTNPNGHTTILYELAEVHHVLDQHPTPDLPPATWPGAAGTHPPSGFPPPHRPTNRDSARFPGRAPTATSTGKERMPQPTHDPPHRQGPVLSDVTDQA